ncbi:MAG TPA: carboxypeptidase regulatory-like domain-containing protein [Terriglobales bacterium]|nr:carboxypeptidase regulatory-like domain-containing protein [Terriglobales bacterium]
MHLFYRSWLAAAIVTVCVMLSVGAAKAQSGGGTSSGISGTVLDPSGAVVANATVEIHNAVSGFDRTTTTDINGRFSFPNVPFNPYHMTVTAPGFGQTAEDVEIRSALGVNVKVSLAVAGSSEAVTVEAGADLVENDPIGHTDVDRGLFDKIPLESQSSSVSSLITLSSPGVSADSNGLFHGLGDHASNSFSVDDQPITDQQSKIFSNQIPVDSIQSLEVIPGAPPAEYGGKTSLVIVATTRSGQGATTPHGSVNASYGSFGSSNVGVDLAYGGQKWGNFISVNGLNSGRFLDPPEFRVAHAKGNEENLFDRVDYQLSTADSIRLNFGFSRSWFQTPNSVDGQLATPWNGVVVANGGLDPNGNVVGPTDQRALIKTFNIAPSWTRVINPTTVFSLGGWVRRDAFNYYPSKNPFADLGPSNLQQETVSQYRTLANAGVRSDLSYVKGINNVKFGVTYQQTFLTEHFNFGIVDPTLNAPCLDANGVPVFVGNPGLNDTTQCGTATTTSQTLYPTPFQVNPGFTPLLGCYDLTRPTPSSNDGCAGSSSTLFPFRGHTDVKELAIYLQDAISKGNWSLNVGLRGDFYNGLVTARQAEPRVGVAYNIKRTNTVLRVSYARTLESPFNENLVLSSSGCQNAVVSAVVPCVSAPLEPGYRNDFHAGLQQAFGRYAVVSGDYIWKYTHTAYDFSIFAATPIFFPIGWHNSKIPGYAIRVSVPDFHGFTALVVMSSVAARFFPPQTSGLGVVTVGQGGLPFRIDHDEKFNQTTHLQYQPWKNAPWVGFNWRYDSGLVAGAVPFATDTTTPVDLTGFTADQQLQAGLFCGSQRPTLSTPLTTCAPSLYGSTLVKIPAPGTQNDDHNPARIAPRHLFDVAMGDDNLFKGERYKWSLTVTAINVANKTALYNFLSTFSGTHYVTPRAVTAQLGFHF